MSTDMTMEKDIMREMKGVGVKLSKEMLSKCKFTYTVSIYILIHPAIDLGMYK